MKYLLLLLPLLFACSPQPQMESMISDSGESKGLHKVSKTSFKEFYASADTDFGEYTQLHFLPLNLDDLSIDTRRLDISDRDWTFTEKDAENVQGYFQDRVEAAFQKNDRFALADEAGPGVLTVAFDFLEFSPTAPRDDAANRPGRQTIFTRGIGGLKIKAKITDSQTNEILAYLEDYQEVGESTRPERNDRVNNIRNLRLEIASWLTKLKNTLAAL